MGFGGHGIHGHSHDSDDHDHNHSHGSHKNKCSCSKTVRLSTMLSLTFSFFIVELVVGHITHSLTLVADSFHMLSDVIALCIGLFSVRISKKKSSKNTFGWVRAEVLGALINSVFLVSLCLSIIIEAIERFIENENIKNVDLLLYVACAGLAINLIGLFIFGHGHSHSVPQEAVKKLEELEGQDDDDDDEDHYSNEANFALNSIKAKNSDELVNQEQIKPLKSDMIDARNSKNLNSEKVEVEKNRKCCAILSKQANLNIKAVFLHVLADALGSVVVIISALLNKYSTELKIPATVIRYIDPSLCLILVALILTSTIPLFKETALILLQTVPKDIELSQLKAELHKINGIVSVHELHVWKLSGKKIIATAHITCHNLQEYMEIASKVKVLFHEKGIHSTTIQPEFIDPINSTNNDCLLECVTDCNANTCCGQSNQPNSLRLRSQNSSPIINNNPNKVDSKQNIDDNNNNNNRTNSNSNC